MNWNQPICFGCFDRRYPNRTPVRLREPKVEHCCDCGRWTASGIYIRLDPRTVRYPTEEEELGALEA